MYLNARIRNILLIFGTLAFVTPTLAAEPTYDQARWDPIHFKPAIDQAKNEDCLKCHKEVLEDKVLAKSPAGVAADEALAWYQTLDTYTGEQETFHRRHLVTPMAKQVMDLKCNTCHQGNDPREETANSSATGSSDLTQRKQVSPEICLMCHGKMNIQAMGLPGPWEQSRDVFKTCMTCHAAIRTVRHQVNFLKPEVIEAAGKENSDNCYGCHGGRSWYRIPFPYPRHVWPGSAEVVPDWAKDRSKESNPRFTSAAPKADGSAAKSN